MSGRKAGFYVYRIYDGFETVYVGKGSGKRLSNQRSRFHLPGEILEECNTEDQAFKFEMHWIELLKPTENKNAGGLGGRVKPKRKKPLYISPEDREINRVGSRRYVAKFLLTKLNHRNCIRFGLSKLDLNRLSEVANGPRC